MITFENFRVFWGFNEYIKRLEGKIRKISSKFSKITKITMYIVLMIECKKITVGMFQPAHFAQRLIFVPFKIL